MDPRALIPAADPIPLPAPLALLRAMLPLAFFLHLLPMNFLLGGGLTALWLRLRAGDVGAAAERRRIVALLPGAAAATFILGMPLLLLMPALHGRAYFPATILAGHFWLLIIPALLFAYAVFDEDRLGPAPAWAGLLACLALLYVAFMHSYVHLLGIDPSGWWSHYAQGRGGRLAFAGDLLRPALPWRWLHLIAGAFAVTGLGLMAAARAGGPADPATSAALLRRGAATLAGGVAAAALTGPAQVAALPAVLRREMLSASPAGGLPWMLGTVLIAASAVMLLAVARRPARDAARLWRGGLALSLASLIAMVWQRHLLRERCLDLAGAAEMGPTAAPQWGAAVLVAAILALGAVLVLSILVNSKQRSVF